MSIRTLKLITIFAPAIIVYVLEVLRHTFFIERDPMTIGNIIMALIFLVGSFFLVQFIFGIIEKAQKESTRRNQELATLNSVAVAVNESLNLDVVLYRALDKLQQTTGAEAGEIFLKDENTREMVRRVHSGLLPEGFYEKASFQKGEGFVGSVTESGESIISNDVSDERWLFIKKMKDSGFDCVVGVPLNSKYEVIGVIVLATKTPKRFTIEDRQLLDSIGNQITVAIDNARLHQKVQQMATMEERERIARELHDGIVQILGYVNAKTQAARQVLAAGSTAQAESYLKEVEDVARDAYSDVRETILGLRNTGLLEKGMLPTLKEYVMRFSHLSNIKTELEVSGGAISSLPANAELQIIRIVQESLTNVRKHSRANRAWVRISSRDGLANVVIEDDGQGFDPTRLRRENEPRFGLQAMKERAESIKGNLDVTSVPGSGTKVTLTVPLARSEMT